MAYNMQPCPQLINMASLDLHQKEGFDIALQNLSLVEEVSGKVEEKIRNRLDLIRSRTF
jgi:hypothetical protein